MATEWKFGERWEMVVEKVRDEPPQKWRNMRVGLRATGEPEEKTWRHVLESTVYFRECCMLDGRIRR